MILPIDGHLPEIIKSLKENPNLVLIAEPGAGKSTRVPPALTKAFKNEFICLQPRRIAAKLCAERVAEELNVKLGEEVGYHVRFDKRFSPRTRIRFVTEALLTRYLLNDPELKNVSGVILDEFHERSIHSDLALALLRELQETYRPDLKIIVMSATLDPAPVSSFLSGAPILKVPGRTYPVEKKYLPKTPELFHKSELQNWIKKSVESTRAEEGHTLVFLPGKKEIDWAYDALSELSRENRIFRLHSSLNSDEQHQALAPSQSKKIILATNIAETSVTIDGVRTVIDTGLARVVRCDAQLGLDRLELTPISQASADQRAGRAGRQAPGLCIRLWSEADQSQRRPFETPEILRSDLSHTLLYLAEWGVSDFSQFHFFQPPPKSLLDRSIEMLREIGALDSKNNITPLGKELSSLPLHPRFGTLFLEAKRRGHEKWGASIALLLNEDRSNARYLSDLEKSPVLSHANFQRQLRSLTESHEWKSPPKDELDEIILKVYQDRLTANGIMRGGRAVELEQEHPARHSKDQLWVSVDPREVKKSNQTKTLVSMIHEVSIETLKRVFQGEVKEIDTVFYDEKQERVISERTLGFRALALQPGKRIQGPPELLSKCLFDHFKEQAKEFVLKSEACSNFYQRVLFLEKHASDHGWSSQFLEELFEKTLEAACADSRSKKDLETYDFWPTLTGGLSFEKYKELDQHAPERIELPNKKSAKMTYQDGSAILEVKLQHLFGWKDAPRLAYGRAKIKLHLLSPSQRPVQITEDLMSFWKNGYPEVRKELRARYPKHPWPENPLA